MEGACKYWDLNGDGICIDEAIELELENCSLGILLLLELALLVVVVVLPPLTRWRAPTADDFLNYVFFFLFLFLGSFLSLIWNMRDLF